MRNPIDGRVHISELKQMAKSPAHYALACAEARTVTRPMRVGAIADAIVFGNRGYAVYPGKVRSGKEWQAWEREHAGIVTCIQSELEDAMGAAKAVLSDPLACELLRGGDYQVTAQWDAYGLPMAAGIPGQRGGLDLIGRGCELTDREPFVADLKITDSEPFTFSKHAWRMLWHAQLAGYMDACEAIGRPVKRAYLIGCEPSPPHCVTVMPVSEAALASGRKSLCLWAERLRQCEADGRFPGYVERLAEPLDVPAWEVEDVDV